MATDGPSPHEAGPQIPSCAKLRRRLARSPRVRSVVVPHGMESRRCRHIGGAYNPGGFRAEQVASEATPGILTGPSCEHTHIPGLQKFDELVSVSI